MKLVIPVLLALYSAATLAATSTSLSGSSVSSLDSVKATPSVWSANYFSFSKTNYNLMNKETASIDTFGYVAFNYQVAPTWKVGVRPSFYFQSSGAALSRSGGEVQNDSRWVPDDFQITASSSELFWANQWKTFGTFYYYLPTSDYSKSFSSNGNIRSWLQMDRIFSKYLDITFHWKPRWYFQSVPNSRQAESEHYVGFYEPLNQYVTLQEEVGFKSEWYNGRERVDFFRLIPGVKLNASNNAWLIFAVEDRALLTGPTNVAIGQTSDMVYEMFAYVGI